MSELTYKALFNERINDMYAKTKRGELPRELRMREIEVLTDWYVEESGERPECAALDKLADLVLYEDLFNPSLTKMKDEEYPIMSERQYDRRQKGELATGEAMEMNAADGKTHTKPNRRNRSSYENKLIDKKVRSRNRERKRMYAEFVRVQPVIVSKDGDRDDG